MLVRRTGGIIPEHPEITEDTSDFWKIVLKAYPDIVVDENTYWKKITHNYKLAIYNKTYEKYKDAWNVRDLGFGAIMIEVVNGKMKVSFTQAFLYDFQTLYPEQIHTGIGGKRRFIK